MAAPCSAPLHGQARPLLGRPSLLAGSDPRAQPEAQSELLMQPAAADTAAASDELRPPEREADGEAGASGAQVFMRAALLALSFGGLYAAGLRPGPLFGGAPKPEPLWPSNINQKRFVISRNCI